MDTLLWKSDWPQARRALQQWWEHRGLALHVTAPRDEPREHATPPDPNAPANTQRQNAEWWAQTSLAQLARTFWGGVAAPMFNTNIGGPGSLGLFLGCIGHPEPETVWYEPCIVDPENYPPLRFDRTNKWWKLHLDLIEKGRQRSHGRYLVGVPDLIENIDTLAQLRGSEETLMDLVERPDWVKAKISEINQAFFDCFDALWEVVRDPWAGNTFTAFSLWGPGKTAKVQCDFSCMISPAMFREFVVPALAEQCAWLEYSMYHLDGTQAMQHLPALLEIESLDAIEWTPQAGLPGGGSPEWYDLYRQIKAAGKSVQAVSVAPDEVGPLIDAVGADGMFITTWGDTEQEARDLLRRFGWEGEC